jgi:hypothetical protein
MTNYNGWPFQQGPFLNAAVLCEKILQETDGVVSPIRIVDRLTIQARGENSPSEMASFSQQFTLLLTFKSGDARGPLPLEVRLQRPSGESPPPLRQSLNFEGDDDRGVNFITKLDLKLEMPGLYWFDIFLDGQRITRIPLRVIYLPS